MEVGSFALRAQGESHAMHSRGVLGYNICGETATPSWQTGIRNHIYLR